MEQWRRNFLIGAGFIEALFFSGCLFGWPSLLLILQKEGVFGHVCKLDPTAFTSQTPYSQVTSASSSLESQQFNNLPSGCAGQLCDFQGNNITQNLELDASAAQLTCHEQAIELTLVYTFAAVLYGIMAVFIGLSLDYLGLRVTRLIGSTFVCAGFLFLAFTSTKHWYFLWPALNLIALGSNKLRFSGFQFAEFCPELRATILVSYSSAYSISTTFFIAVQLLHEDGIPMKIMFLGCAGLSALTYIPTFFILKGDSGERWSFRKNDKKRGSQQDEKYSGFSRSSSYGNEIQQDLAMTTFKANNNDDEHSDYESESSEEPSKTCPFQAVFKSITSLSGGLHTYWQFINLFMILFYSSTFNLWASRVNDDHISLYIKISGLCALFGPLCIPISGLLTDSMINRAKERNNELERIGYTMQAPTFAMFAATSALILTIACKLFISEVAIYLSLILIAVSRPAVVGTCMSYIRLRFPADQFNMLNGFFTTFISLLCFIQYPIMRWLVASDESYIQVHILLLTMLAISLISPAHMMVRRNVMKFARQRWMDDLRGNHR